MTTLYEDPWFTFRFADDRIIPRFHLEGMVVGQRVSVIKIDPESGGRLAALFESSTLALSISTTSAYLIALFLR
jgi:hypothetical protein